MQEEQRNKSAYFKSAKLWASLERIKFIIFPSRNQNPASVGVTDENCSQNFRTVERNRMVHCPPKLNYRRDQLLPFVRQLLPTQYHGAPVMMTFISLVEPVRNFSKILTSRQNKKPGPVQSGASQIS